MTKRFHTKAYRRDIEQRKYISRLKENAYWLWIDGGTHRNLKSWTELKEGCKFAKKFKNGGNPEVRGYWEKKDKQKEIERKYAYPKDKEIMDLEDIQVYTSPNWEDFCGACDNFNHESCPYFNQVDFTNNWKKDIQCDNFND